MRFRSVPSRFLFVGTLALLLAGPAFAADHGDAPILVGGEPLAHRNVRRIVVEQALHGFAVAEVEARGVDPATAIGAVLEIRSDSDPATPPLFVGEVVAVEPQFAVGGRSSLEIRGFDRLHRLHRGRHTRSFQGIGDAALAERIAGEHGLEASAADPGYAPGTVFQRNESNLDFLRQRAARIGFALSVEGDTLRFGPPAPEPAAQLAFGSNLRSFQLEPSTSAAVQKVEVRGWDPEKKEAIVGQAGDAAAPPGATVIFDRAHPLSEEPMLAEGQLFSSEEAALVAQAALAEAAGAGRGVAEGDPRIRPGVHVELSGLGARFDGRYLVTGTTHTIQPSGYTTQFRVRRDAMKGPARP